jgi:hypothetical protein
LLGAITIDELHDWAEFYMLEPWGSEVDDLRNAMLATTVARSAGAKDASLADFRVNPQAEPASDDDVAIDALFGRPPQDAESTP